MNESTNKQIHNKMTKARNKVDKYLTKNVHKN